MASDSDNNSPDWLDGLMPEEEPAENEPTSADNSAWMDEPEGTDDAPVGGQGVVPDWLENIRSQEGTEEPDQDEPSLESGSLSPEDKKDTANWLENIRNQYAKDTGQLEVPPETDPPAVQTEDYMERVQNLKEQDHAVPPLKCSKMIYCPG